MNKFGLILVAEVIKSKAVLLFVHRTAEFVLELAALSGIQNAIKYGILNPLTIVDTFLGNLAQPFWPAASWVLTSYD